MCLHWILSLKAQRTKDQGSEGLAPWCLRICLPSDFRTRFCSVLFYFVCKNTEHMKCMLRCFPWSSRSFDRTFILIHPPNISWEFWMRGASSFLGAKWPAWHSPSREEPQAQWSDMHSSMCWALRGSGAELCKDTRVAGHGYHGLLMCCASYLPLEAPVSHLIHFCVMFP